MRWARKDAKMGRKAACKEETENGKGIGDIVQTGKGETSGRREIV